MTRDDRELEGGWQLVGTDGEGHRVSLVFGETQLMRAYPGLTVGRHRQLCELVVDDPTVSRRHARVCRDGDGLAVEDLNSMNGTIVDGVMLQPFQPTIVTAGQTLQIGHVVLRLTALENDIAPRDRGVPR